TLLALPANPSFDILVSTLNAIPDKTIHHAQALRLAVRRNMPINTEWVLKQFTDSWMNEEFQRHLCLALIGVKPDGPSLLADISSRLPAHKQYGPRQDYAFRSKLLSTWLNDPSVQLADISRLMETLALQYQLAFQSNNTELFDHLTTL